MDLDLAHRQSQRVLKQRNLFAAAAAGLFVLLSATFLVMANRQREVILVPTVHATYTLDSGHPSQEYLEAVTKDAMFLALNRSPENLDYWMNSLLSIADESARGQLKVDLVKIYQQQAGSQISQFFTPDQVKVDPVNLTSEESGTLHTIAANKEVSSEHRTFKMVWSYNGVSLKLVSFGAVTKVEPPKP